MRHFDTWIIRDPYSIWHYYNTTTTDNPWTTTIRNLITTRSICSPKPSSSPPVTPYTPSPHPQNSPLLRLPPELRQIIWSYVFGSSTLHLVTIKNKVRHVRCSLPNSPSLTHHRHCCPITTARWRTYDGRIPGHSDKYLYPHTHDLLPSRISNSNVALLRTCRAIYAETEHVLYRNSTFDVDDLYTFIAFTESISDCARRAIRRLTVQWMPVWEPLAGEESKGSVYAFTHSDELWKRFWGRVAGLELVELRLSVDLGRFTGSVVGGGPVIVAGRMLKLGAEEKWLKPLLGVRGLGDFDLAVTVRCDEVARGVVEGGLVRDVAVLRDLLRGVMCEGREGDGDGDVDGEGSGLGKRRLIMA